MDLDFILNLQLKLLFLNVTKQEGFYNIIRDNIDFMEKNLQNIRDKINF